MKDLNIPVLLLLCLSGLVRSQLPETVIDIGFNQAETMTDLVKIYKLKVPENTPYIKIKTIPYNPESPINFFLGDKPNPTYSGSRLKQFKGGVNMLSLYLNDPKAQEMYLSVYSPIKNAKFQLQFIKMVHSYIEIGEEINISSILSTPYLWKPMVAEDTKKRLYFYAIAGNAKDISMIAKLQTENSVQEFKVSQQFKTGYGVFIDLASSLIPDYTKINITITIEEKTKTEEGYLTDIKFGLREVKEEQDFLYFFDEVIGYVDMSYRMTCHPLVPISAGSQKNVIVNIVSYQEPLRLTIRDASKKQLREVMLEEIDSALITQLPEHKFICLEKLNELPSATYIMQVLDYASIEVNQAFIAPILNGIQTKYTLPPGKTMSFRRKRFASHFNASELNLHPVVGDSRLYAYQCKEYPCNMNGEEIVKTVANKTIYRANDVNEDYHLAVPYNATETPKPETFYSSNKLLGVVQCYEVKRTCTFFFTMYFESEEVELIPMQKFKSIVTRTKRAIKGYSFTNYLQSIVSLKFVLHCYTGDALIQVFAPEGVPSASKVEFYGNKKILVFEKKTGATLRGKYAINVETESASYYSIHLETRAISIINDSYIESGEVTLFTLTPGDNVRNFKFLNRLTDNLYPMIINFKTVNCKLEYALDGQPASPLLGDVQIQFDPAPPGTPQEFVTYKLNVAKDFFFAKEPNYVCMVFMSAIEIDYIKDLVLSENTDYVLEVAKKRVPEMTFSYPFSYDKLLTQVFLELIYYKKDFPLKVAVSFEGHSLEPVTFKIELNRGRKLVFRATDFEKVCRTNELCNMNIVVGVKKDDYDLSFRINVKSSNSIPIYINTQAAYKSIVDLNGIQHFYTDIYPGREGEVSVIFNKGSGSVYARIVAKGSNESKGWNGHVILPAKNVEASLMLPFDYYNRRIQFSKEDTNKCSSGCELFVGVAAETVPEDPTPSANVAEYSILIRGLGMNSYSQILINEYAFGSLPAQNGVDLYLINIPFDASVIKFHLISEFAFLSINKGTTAPVDFSKSDWIINEPNGILTLNVNDPKLGAITSFKGQNFNFAVKVRDAIVPGSSRYALKVSASDPKLPPLTQLTNEQNEICVFTKDNDTCNLIRSVNSFETLKDFNIFVESMDNVHNLFVIYANLFEAQKYETAFAPEDIPSASKAQFSSEKNPNKDYLNIPLSGDKENYYVVISIVCYKPGKAMVYTTSTQRINFTTLAQNAQKLFKVPENIIFGLHFNGGKKYLANFVLLSGNGFIKKESEKLIVMEDSMLIEVPDKEKEYDLLVHSKTGMMFTVNYFTINDSIAQVKELKFGKDNIIINDPINFNNTYYFKMLSESSDRLHTVINFKLAVCEIDGAVKGNEDFDINAYVVDKDFIVNAKKNPAIAPPKEVNKAVYNPISHVGLIELFKSNQTNDNEANINEEKYIYLTIAKSKDNNNTYTRLNFEISATPTSLIHSIYAFPNNNYYYNALDSKSNLSLLKLTKYNATEKRMLIEFASCVDDDSVLGYAVKNYYNISGIDDAGMKQSDPSLIISNNTKSGKTTIEVDLSTTEIIGFVVFATKQVSKPLNYVVKYITGETVVKDKDIELSEPKLNATYNKFNQMIKVDWKSVKSNNTALNDTEYIYRVFNHGMTKPASMKASICLIQNNTNGLSKRYLMRNESKSYTKEESFEAKKGMFLEVSIVAFVDDVDQEKMLLYESALLEVENLPVFPAYVYYLIGAIGVVIIIGFGVYLGMRYSKKRHLEIETNAVLGGPNMPLVDDN